MFRFRCWCYQMSQLSVEVAYQPRNIRLCGGSMHKGHCTDIGLKMGLRTGRQVEVCHLRERMAPLQQPHCFHLQCFQSWHNSIPLLFSCLLSLMFVSCFWSPINFSSVLMYFSFFCYSWVLQQHLESLFFGDNLYIMIFNAIIVSRGISKFGSRKTNTTK